MDEPVNSVIDSKASPASEDLPLAPEPEDLTSAESKDFSPVSSFTSPVESELPKPSSEPETSPPSSAPAIEDLSGPGGLPTALPARSSGGRRGWGKLFFYLIFFVIVAGGGLYLQQIWPKLSLALPWPGKVERQLAPAPTEEAVTTIAPAPAWKVYQVVSGTTKQPIVGLSFQLPDDVLSPICDGSTCASQGTYLPGGTRFTLAVRGKGQILPDFRGTLISDVGGRVFTQNQATVAGQLATEFSGTFRGTTVGGYAFTQMRGFMIIVNDNLSFEINHFTPTGIAADFSGDDALFDKIVTTVKFE